MVKKWWKYPKFGEDTKDKLEKKAEKSGLKLPTWALYPKAEGFEYVGFLRKSDRKIDNEGLFVGDEPKHLKALKDNPKVMKESEKFGISPYLTESAGEITPKTYRDKDTTDKIKVEGYEGKTHPLPDKEKQQRMHKRARKWSREGPLLPKTPLKTKSDLTQTKTGRNAREKL